MSPKRPGYLEVVRTALDPVPDHVLLIAFPTDGAQIMRDWRVSGLAPNARWLATDGLRSDKLVLGAGGAAAGIIGTAPLLAGAHYLGFDARYKNAFGGEEPGIFTSNQYDAVVLIALGIANAGVDASNAEIREAIRSMAGAPGTPA